MGFGMANLEYLDRRGFLDRTTSFLDIGSQNLYSATPESVMAYARKFGPFTDEELIRSEAERISYFSTPRPGERTAYLSELIDLTNQQYTSYDVCMALKTEIFDLNCEHLPPAYQEHFDIVLNFGTTEHITNQLNSFRVMHDAMKVGGITFHQLPSVGWIEHGYFCYHLTFFRDLAKANGYEILEWWYTLAGQSEMRKCDLRDAVMPLEIRHEDGTTILPNINLNVVLKKNTSAAFKVGLELETSHSALSPETAEKYPDGVRVLDDALPVEEPAANLSLASTRALLKELMRRILPR